MKPLLIVLAVLTSVLLAGCGGSSGGAAQISKPSQSKPTLAEVACASTEPEDEDACPRWADECAAVSDTKRETFQCVRQVIAKSEKDRNDEFMAQKAAEVEEFRASLTLDNYDKKCGVFIGDNPPTEGNASAYIDACTSFGADY